MKIYFNHDDLADGLFAVLSSDHAPFRYHAPEGGLHGTAGRGQFLPCAAPSLLPARR